MEKESETSINERSVHIWVIYPKYLLKTFNYHDITFSKLEIFLGLPHCFDFSILKISKRKLKNL